MRRKVILSIFFKSIVLSLFVLIGATLIIFFTVYLAPGRAEDVLGYSIQDFKITEQSLKTLKSEGVPDDVLKKLENIKNQEVTGEKNFVDILNKTIGEEQTVKFKSSILKHARKKKHPIIMYCSWLIGIIHFDFGKSQISRLPVTYELAAPFIRTIILTIGSLCITLGLAVPIGVLSATHRHPLLSSIASIASYLVSAAPIYWLGYIVIYLFAKKLGWFALSTGAPEPVHKVLLRFILMIFLLGIGNGALGEIIRHIREEVSNILQQEYIQAALARGANIWKHVGKNSVVPIIGIVTSHLTLLLGGAIVVEKVFSFPGIGYKAFTAADEQDYPIVLGITVLLVLFVRIIKIASDFICGMVDPRFLSGDSTKN